MGIFGPPSVEKMKAGKDIKGLLKALGYQKDSQVRVDAAGALEELGWKPDFDALKEALKNGHDEVANLLTKKGTIIDIRSLWEEQQQELAKGSKYNYKLLAKLSDGIRYAHVILLGLDPWWREDTQERRNLIQQARELIKPEGEELTELLIRILTQDNSVENRVQAALVLGILNADLELFEAKGLMNYPLLAYIDWLGHERLLCLSDIRSRLNNAIRGGPTDPRVVQALRGALDDSEDIDFDFNSGRRTCPCLYIPIGLLGSEAQLRTIAGKLQKGEPKEQFYLIWHKGVRHAAALSLVLIGDKESARRIVEAGWQTCVGEYKRTLFFKLAYDIGFNDVAVELARIYMQGKDVGGHFKEFKKGYMEGIWASECLSVMNDLERVISTLEGEDRDVLKAATEALNKPG